MSGVTQRNRAGSRRSVHARSAHSRHTRAHKNNGLSREGLLFKLSYQCRGPFGSPDVSKGDVYNYLTAS